MSTRQLKAVASQLKLSRHIRLFPHCRRFVSIPSVLCLPCCAANQPACSRCISSETRPSHENPSPFTIVSFQPLGSSFSPSVLPISQPTAVAPQLKLSRHMRPFPHCQRFVSTSPVSSLPCRAANQPSHSRCISIDTQPSHETLPSLSTFRFSPFLPRLCCLEALGGYWKKYKRVEIHLHSCFLFSYPPASNHRPRESLEIFIRTSIHPNHHPHSTTREYSVATPNFTPRNPTSYPEPPQATQHSSRWLPMYMLSPMTFPKITVSAKLLHCPRYLRVLCPF